LEGLVAAVAVGQVLSMEQQQQVEQKILEAEEEDQAQPQVQLVV
jgi:hypothetical protein